MVMLVAGEVVVHDPATALGRGVGDFVIELRRGAGIGHRPLHLIHPFEGHVYVYQDLVDALGGDEPVRGIRARGVAAGEEPFADVAAMARHHVDVLLASQPEGPYLLGGSSLGGTVAWAMAHELHARGREVALLFLIDTFGPGHMPPRPADDAELLQLVAPGRFTARELAEVGAEEALRRALAEAIAGAPLPAEDPAVLSERYVRLMRCHTEAFFDYQPPPYPGEAIFLRAAARRPSDPEYPERAWTELAAGLTVYTVPGEHTTINQRPQVTAIGNKLRLWLDRLQG